MDRKIKLVTSSITRRINEEGSQFVDRMLKEIKSWDSDTFFGVFPEYCWGELEFIYTKRIIKVII